MINKKYFIYNIILSIFLVLFFYQPVRAEICISDSETTDLITLLDASERDLTLLVSCNKLVEELYTELDKKDKKIVELTDNIIKANKEVIKYKNKYNTAKKIAWYTSIVSATIILIQVAPLL